VEATTSTPDTATTTTITGDGDETTESSGIPNG
jgi:hypothetical protein